MPEQQHQSGASIDDAVRRVIFQATSDATEDCHKSFVELTRKLASVRGEVSTVAADLQMATGSAGKAVKAGERAIRKLRQTVWTIASVPLCAGLAELYLLLGQVLPIGSLDVETVRAIGRLVGAIPLTILACIRGWGYTSAKISRSVRS